MQSIYIAGPLTTAGYREENVRQACQVAMEFLEKGHPVFVPHLYEVLESECLLNMSHDEWMDAMLPWLYASDVIVFLPGWEQSEGAVMEYRRAVELGKVIVIYERYCKARERIFLT